MRKNLFFVAAAALVLASCNNDVKLDENVALADSNAQKEIAFTSYHQGPKHVKSNAPVGNDEAFPTSYNFFISAYSAVSSGDYFNKAEYANQSSTIWSGKDASNKKYWPLAEETLNFLAVTKQTAGGYDATFGESEPAENFAKKVVVALADNHSEQHDLMYAFGRGEVTKSGNVLIFPDKVDMEFNHALAWVYFRVKAASTLEQAITVNSITLNGANYSGTFTAVVTNYDKAVGGGDLAWNSRQWSSPGSNGNYASPNHTPAALGLSFANVGDGLLIVPTGSLATPAAAFTSFTINYTLNGNDYDYEYTPTVEQRKLTMGKKYLFDITFRLHEILVNASVADWDETAPVENVDITPVSYAHNAAADNTGNFPTAGTIAANAGIYSFQVTGLKSTDDVTVAAGTGGTGTLTSVTHVYNTTTKVATVTFEVPANAANTAKTYVIDVTDSGTNGSTHKTTITVNQAAAE